MSLEEKKLNDIAYFLKAKRKQMGYTQKDLADISGVGIQTVRDLEHGQMNLRMDKVERVLNAVGYKISTARKN